MHVIGLTGGVGSGKSLAAQLLKELAGAELLIADNLGHLAMQKGSAGYEKIVHTFGDGILEPGGEIDRERLAQEVFDKEECLQQLNSIIHPEVKKYIEHYIAQRRTDEGTIILESAILFETGCDSLCDEVWYVRVPEEVRIKRLGESRGYSREKCQAIMAQQMTEEAFRSRCGQTVCNDGSVETLKEELKRCLDVSMHS